MQLYEKTLAAAPPEANMREALEDLGDYLESFPDNAYAQDVRQKLEEHISDGG